MNVRDVNDLGGQYGALCGATAIGRAGVRGPKGRGAFGIQLLERPDVNLLAVEPEKRAEIGLAKAQRVGRDRVEYRLHIRRRPADHAQDLAGRGLLLQRLREVAVARPELIEEPHIFDGDYRLIGERLQQLYLCRRKWSCHVPIHGDRSNGFSVAQHRHGKRASNVRCLGNLLVRVLGIRNYVRDMNDGSGKNGPARRAASVRKCRIDITQCLGSFWIQIAKRGDMNKFAVESKNGAAPGVTQAQRTCGDGIEYRLHIGLRLADRAQDLAGRRLLLERFLGGAELANVFDGDRGLRGKRLDQGNLVGREQSNLAAQPVLHAGQSCRQFDDIGFALVHQRYRQDGPHPAPFHVLRCGRIIGVEQRNHVGVMNGCAVEHGPAGDGSPLQWHWLDRRIFAVERIVGQHTHEAALGEDHARERRMAKAGGLFRDRCHHRLDIGR